GPPTPIWPSGSGRSRRPHGRLASLMRAVVYSGPDRVTVEDVAEPRLEEPDDALVRVSLAAICGTDLHFVAGHADMAPGTVLGHEVVGEGVAVGAAVRDVRVGARVLSSDVT